MIRRPPRSTRTDTLFPYTTLFRSSVAGGGDTVAALNHAGVADDFTFVSTAGGAFLEWMEGKPLPGVRSEEHTSELQSLMRISYAVFCLKKKNVPLLYMYHVYTHQLTVTHCIYDYIRLHYSDA